MKTRDTSRLATARRVARAEFVLHVRDGRVRIAAALLLMMGVVSVALGWKHQADVSRAVSAAQIETQEQFRSQGKRNPHSGAHFGIYAFRPEPGLGFLERGVDDYIGIAVMVEPHAPSYFRDPPAEDATVLTRFGEWTFARTLQLLAPLLVILLAAPSIASERERGTLGLLRAQGVRGMDLMVGKAAGVALTVLVAVTPAGLVAWIGSLVISEAARIDLARMGLFFVGHALFLLTILLVAMAISARAQTAQRAIVVGIGFWACVSLAAPRLGVEIARRLYPTPSAFAFEKGIQRETWHGEPDKWDTAQRSITKGEMARRGLEREIDLPINVAGMVLQRQEDEDAVVFDRHYDRLHGVLASQDRVLDVVGIVSPFLAVQSVSMSAAEADAEHNAHFWRATETYRRRLVGILNAYMTNHTGGNVGYSVLVEREAWSLVPPFSYEAPSVRLAIRRSLLPLMVLVMWALAAFGACVVASRRVEKDD